MGVCSIEWEPPSVGQCGVEVGGEGGEKIHLRQNKEVDCIRCKGTGGQASRKACAMRQWDWNTP